MAQRITIDANLHHHQMLVHQSPARFRVLAKGRRWGKTRLGVFECFDIASQGGRAWWIAPSYKMSEVGWRPVRRMASQIGAEIRKVDRQVILPNGGEIAVRSADNPDSLRGEGLNLAVMDECAYMHEEAWSEAIRPALSDKQGKAIFISTPKGRNWFWRLFQRGLETSSEWQSWQGPTKENPFIPESEIEKARLDLPELIFEQEYLGVFLEDQGAVFRNIAACMNASSTIPDRHEKHQLIAGIDWGKQNDFTAISIGCKTCRQEVARDRFNKIDYIFQSERLKVLFDRWHPSPIMAEANAMGTPIIEQLHRAGLPVVAFDTTPSSKPPLVENLALILERAEWQFQDDPIWRGELEAYQRIVSPITGRSQYSAPEGMHDDTVIARALMVKAGQLLPLTIMPESKSKWRTEPREDGMWRKY